jgi:hypothetical protein
MESYQQYVDAIETDLGQYGFTDEEILKLWLIDQGLLLTEVLNSLPCPNFFRLIFNGFESNDFCKPSVDDQQSFIQSVKQKLVKS